jgi:hypothetical protein
VRCAVTGSLAHGQAYPLCRAGDALGMPCTDRLGQRVGVAWGNSRGRMSIVEHV